jgi:glycolate oxidase FAD binding subunit
MQSTAMGTPEKMQDSVTLELQDLCNQVADANANATDQANRGQGVSGLQILGGGSKSFLSGAALEPSTNVLNTRSYFGVVDYEPSELVMTARAGTSLLEIENVLGERGQMLGFEPPHFGANATIGGAVASGLSGPRRAAAGSARDFVLGVQMIDRHGKLLRFGGRVVKNVAGYDVSRLVTGSMGILGPISEVSFKVLPKPIQEESIVFECGQSDALLLMNEWAGEPLPISATCWSGNLLVVRLSGAPIAVEGARKKLGGELLPRGAEFWLTVREHTHPFFKWSSSNSQAPVDLWRLSVPSTAPQLVQVAQTFIEWGGAVRWAWGGVELRDAALKVGGTASLFRPSTHSRFKGQRQHPLDSVTQKIHERLKQQFDPYGIFNPSRLIAGL